jgi:hypothetical protein
MRAISKDYDRSMNINKSMIAVARNLKLPEDTADYDNIET